MPVHRKTLTGFGFLSSIATFPATSTKSKTHNVCEKLYRKGEAVSFTARLHRRGGPEHHSVPAHSCPAGRSNLISDNYFTL
jgi:hypothetical protein